MTTKNKWKFVIVISVLYYLFGFLFEGLQFERFIGMIFIQLFPVLFFLFIYGINPYTSILNNSERWRITQFPEGITVPGICEPLFKPHGKFTDLFTMMMIPGLGTFLFINISWMIIKAKKIFKKYGVTNEMLKEYCNKT